MRRKNILLCIYILAFTKLNKNVDDRTFSEYTLINFSTCINFPKIALFFFFNLFIYLFLAVLGLRFCARTFSSCGKRGPLFIAVRGPPPIAASCCGAQAPDAQAQ